MEELENVHTAQKATDEEVIDAVFTVPNIISFVRLCMAPVFLVLLLNGLNIEATVVYAIAAGTDFVDGKIARATHTVSRIGQLLDPFVDRLLMLTGVFGLLMCGRLPIWIVLLILARDLFMLIGGAYLLKKYGIRVAVIYPGKVATTFLFVGCAGLLLNLPLIPGLGWVDVSWLPGFNAAMCSWGIWFVYAGLILGVCTTTYYIMTAVKLWQAARSGR